MLFDGWWGLLRVLVVGGLAYVALVALLRVTGKRTLAKMSAFDLVVTVALGSTLATVLLSGDVALAEGLAGFVLLALLQMAIAWGCVRSARLRQLVKSEPCLLLREGQFLHAAMRQERVTEDEVRAALRGAGLSRLEDAAAVVLETDGSFSVLRAPAGGGRSTLEGVRGA
ncbi:DUF421 domain-containing protein [Roseococcus sp. DSY-14]|uniref:DUF421 domain-containing protein n=1 Tax=Roseococcus sp. DSY-14 TaxID=3369650 RepID=UPI00387B1F47